MPAASTPSKDATKKKIEAKSPKSAEKKQLKQDKTQKKPQEELAEKVAANVAENLQQKAAGAEAGSPVAKTTPSSDKKKSKKSKSSEKKDDASTKKQAAPAAAVASSGKDDKKKSKDAAKTSAAKEEKKEDNKAEEQQYLKPDVHFFLHATKKVLQIQIQLSKVPPQLINLDLKEKSFHVDSLKFTRKYNLDMAYQGGVTVDPEKATAEHKGWSLHIRMPVVDIPKETMEKELKVAEAKRKAKAIKFPQEQPKILTQRAVQTAKDAARKKRKAAERAFSDLHLDIQQKKKKQKTKQQC